MTDELQQLDAKLKVILPEQYRECYEEVQPVSMGSAGLKFDAAGRVAWDEIWQSFCDLAMAGGPPHRGTLLAPPTPEEVAADPKAYRKAVDEICRGIRMVSNLAVNPGLEGFVELSCSDVGMAGWMTRAITMENVTAVLDGITVKLPAGPNFRLEKEIKNVVTSVAKTAHYYVHHVSAAQKRAIAELFSQKPLLQPGREQPAPSSVAAAIGLPISDEAPSYRGWLGLQCVSARQAIWMMRALAVDDILSHRQNAALYVPVNEEQDRGCARLIASVMLLLRLWLLKTNPSGS